MCRFDASVCVDLMLSDSEAPQLAAIEDSDDEEDDDWEPEAAAGMSRCKLSDRHECECEVAVVQHSSSNSKFQ